MTPNLPNADHFFQTARERYRIMLRRVDQVPKPWTEDNVFRDWRFCNVHREDDKTTVWFRENVRDHLSGLPVVEATLIFRWFNRIETGELIKDLLLSGHFDAQVYRERLTGVRPIVTGAYIIKGYDGYDKLNGVLRCLELGLPKVRRFYEQWKADDQLTLEKVWRDLTELDYMGGFMAYEAVSDLRWTPGFNQVTDIMTWANAGPGCARGLGWVVGDDSSIFNTSPASQKRILPLLQELLALSQDSNYWLPTWRPWEMREVEHWLCEYDKYRRASRGDSMKRTFNG